MLARDPNVAALCTVAALIIFLCGVAFYSSKRESASAPTIATLGKTVECKLPEPLLLKPCVQPGPMPPAAAPIGLCFDEGDHVHAPPADGNGKEREHLERPERTRVIWEALVKSGLASRCQRTPVREATRAEALLCHTVEHCDALEALETQDPAMRSSWKGGEGGRGWSARGADMYHNEHTAQAARRAAGGVLALTQRVCSGQLSAGFAVVRPPGHHACSDTMCGFCFLNSAAIAARFAVRRHKVRGVMWGGKGAGMGVAEVLTLVPHTLDRAAREFLAAAACWESSTRPPAESL